MAMSLEGALFPKEVVRTCVRWYVAYLLSYRHIAMSKNRCRNVEPMWVTRRSTGREAQSAAGGSFPSA
jgi:transposase-like protein